MALKAIGADCFAVCSSQPPCWETWWAAGALRRRGIAFAPKADHLSLGGSEGHSSQMQSVYIFLKPPPIRSKKSNEKQEYQTDPISLRFFGRGSLCSCLTSKASTLFGLLAASWAVWPEKNPKNPIPKGETGVFDG